MALRSSNDDLLDPAALQGLNELARCTLCTMRTGPQHDARGNVLSLEDAAARQWVWCAQCRCASAT